LRILKNWNYSNDSLSQKKKVHRKYYVDVDDIIYAGVDDELNMSELRIKLREDVYQTLKKKLGSRIFQKK